MFKYCPICGNPLESNDERWYQCSFETCGEMFYLGADDCSKTGIKVKSLFLVISRVSKFYNTKD